MKISKIVITGGPCAGKTTGMSWIQNAFTERGYKVLFVPEAATQLITGGASPWTLESRTEFQRTQMMLQLALEEIFMHAAENMNSEKVLIVCDRGTIDGKAYLSDEEFDEICRHIDSNIVKLRDSYDAIFHMVTAAKGAEQFYTTSNNTARTETPEEAAAIDDKLIAAWTGHPHLRVINNTGSFEDKMKNLIREIAIFLGEPEPYEVERKFLIEYPDVEKLSAMQNCEKVEIIQTYLKADENEEKRIRQRGANGSYIYFETYKRNVSSAQRIEVEKRLSQEEYLELLMEADSTRRPIRKDRYCLVDGNQYFEIDIYPFWDDKAIMEIELSDINEEIHFPDFIEIIREVTDEEEYRNSNIAKVGI